MPEHNRRSIRLKGYDYRDGGMYFVTICTQNMQCVFGDIRNGIMGLNETGCMVADELQKTPIIRPYVTLDTWVVMPNHVHILLYIDDPQTAHANDVGATRRVAPTRGRLLPQSLGSIVGQFKSVTTKRIRTFNPDFAWQRNYYERISRSPDETARIRRYILDNPARWHAKHADSFLS